MHGIKKGLKKITVFYFKGRI